MKKSENKRSISDGVKKITQDINPDTSSRRSIRDIPIPTNGGVIRKNGSVKKEDTPLDPVDTFENPPKDKSRYFLWTIVFISVIVLVFAVSSLFSGSTVTITPKQQRITLDDILTASEKDLANNIQYQVIQISDTTTKSVESDAEEFVEQKASGSIVIFNTHSSSSQRLVEKTRFQTPDGKIYRIQEGVTVPGMSGESPGQVEVVVFADKSGSEYNIGLTDFTIPGFENDSRFDTFFARSKTPMTGGFSGLQPIINEDTKTEAEVELRELLKENLTADLNTRVSEDLIIPDDSVFYTFEQLPSTEDSEGSVELVYKGTLRTLSLSASGLASRILEKTGEGTSLQVEINNLDDLEIRLGNVEEFDIEARNTANIEVSGDAHLVWVFDEEEIKKDLVGIKKKDLSEVLSAHNEIEKAKAVIRPFWQRSFPRDISKIKVKTALD